MISKELIAFHLRIDQSIKEIMKDGKIDEYDIPEIILMITEIMTEKKMSADDWSDQLSGLYDYIMEHYKLSPTDEKQKQNFRRLFDLSVRLAQIQPNIKTCKTCFFKSSV
jgi:hypothetical protein